MKNYHKIIAPLWCCKWRFRGIFKKGKLQKEFLNSLPRKAGTHI